MSEVGRRLLDLVYNTENGKRDYNLWNTQTQILPTKSMTDMTVQEVMDIQEQNLGNNGGAAGAGQIKLKTMKFLLKDNTLDANELFSPEAQDRAHMRLLRRRGLDAFERGDMPLDDFALELAKEYASFPLLSPIDNKKVGQSYHVGKALNNALITPELFVAGLKNSLLAAPEEVIASDEAAANYEGPFPPRQGGSAAEVNKQGGSVNFDGGDQGILSAATDESKEFPFSGIGKVIKKFLSPQQDPKAEVTSSATDDAVFASIVKKLEDSGVANPEQLAGLLYKSKREKEAAAANSSFENEQALFKELYDSGNAPEFNMIGEPAIGTDAPIRYRDGETSGSRALGRFGIESLLGG